MGALPAWLACIWAVGTERSETALVASLEAALWLSAGKKQWNLGVEFDQADCHLIVLTALLVSPFPVGAGCQRQYS
jgi:hypothetical protein